MMNGILVLNKPAGPTSFDMVRLVKRLTGLRRVGHGGTLDPAASGVLPILLGQATRISEHLLTGRKAYRAEVRLGVVTNTYDSEGEILSDVDASDATEVQVEAALAAFRGAILQTPPMYSAIKQKGKPLYKHARQGIEVKREPRAVEVYLLNLVRWQPPTFTLEVECSKGTYIRSLAYDLGAALGYGAHLRSLVRTRVGPFSITDALSVEALFDAAHGGYLHTRTFAMDWPLMNMPAAILDSDEVAEVRQGRSIEIDTSSLRNGEGEWPGQTSCRAFDPDGVLVGLLMLDDEGATLRPTKIFPASSS